MARPSLSGPTGPLFWFDPPGIHEATKANLLKPVRDLLPAGTVISVTDKTLPAANLSVEIVYA